MNKIIKLGLCGCMAAALISGCSGKKATTETTAAPAAETTAETTTAAATTAAPATGDTYTSELGEVTLGEYKGIKLTAVVPEEITDEQIQAQVDNVLASNPDIEPVTDRPAQDGDTVNIDYVGMKDGVAFDGGTAQGYDLVLGSGSFIDGFESGLIGVNVGDEVSLNLTFPDNYNAEELAGAAVVFDVTVNSISVNKPAVLDDKFVQSISDYKTVAEYKAGIKSDLEASAAETAKNSEVSSALQTVISNATVKADEAAIEEEYNSEYSYYENMATMYGTTISGFAEMYGMTEDDFTQRLHEIADETIKQQLVIDAIAKAENMEVDDADLQYFAEVNGTTLEDVRQQINDDTALDNYAMSYKVVNFIHDNAVLETAPAK